MDYLSIDNLKHAIRHPVKTFNEIFRGYVSKEEAVVVMDSLLTISGSGIGVFAGLFLNQRTGEESPPFTLWFWGLFAAFGLVTLIITYGKWYLAEDQTTSVSAS